MTLHEALFLACILDKIGIADDLCIHGIRKQCRRFRLCRKEHQKLKFRNASDNAAFPVKSLDYADCRH